MLCQIKNKMFLKMVPENIEISKNSTFLTSSSKRAFLLKICSLSAVQIVYIITLLIWFR